MKKRVNITIEESVLKKLDAMAEDRGIDRSTMIALMIYDSYNVLDLRKNGESSNYINETFCQI